MDSLEALPKDFGLVRGAKRTHHSVSSESAQEDTVVTVPEKKKVAEELESAQAEEDAQHAIAPILAPVAPLPVPGVPGLLLIPNFVSNAAEAALMDAIESGVWDTTLRRRVQHFGLRYDYTSKSVDLTAVIEPLPHFMQAVARQIEETALFSAPPNQCIANGTFPASPRSSRTTFSVKSHSHLLIEHETEYYPGQGINAHIDRVDSFGPEVASLSLGSDVLMTFTHGQQSVDVLLERKSLVVLREDSRYKWKHGFVFCARYAVFRLVAPS